MTDTLKVLPVPQKHSHVETFTLGAAILNE